MLLEAFGSQPRISCTSTRFAAIVADAVSVTVLFGSMPLAVTIPSHGRDRALVYLQYCMGLDALLCL